MSIKSRLARLERDSAETKGNVIFLETEYWDEPTEDVLARHPEVAPRPQDVLVIGHRHGERDRPAILEAMKKNSHSHNWPTILCNLYPEAVPDHIRAKRGMKP